MGLPGFFGFSWDSRDFLDFHETPGIFWIFMGLPGFSGFSWDSRDFLDFHGTPWIFGTSIVL
jgi:hypothetical protein